MKYNPKFWTRWRTIPVSIGSPGRAAKLTQGCSTTGHAEEKLCAVTGMAAATLQPAAAPGGVDWLLLMRAYHSANGDPRRRILIPDSATERTRVGDPRGYEVTTVPSMTGASSTSRS